MNVQQTTDKPRLLVAPLDWGLGHATRCIPLIRLLLEEGCDVLLACAGKTEALLRQEFPQLTFLPLPGYNIHYGKTKWELYGKLLLQVPKILEAISKENDWLDAAIDEHRIDAVISDNRYGLYSDRTPSIFITHQLRIQTTMGNTADNFLQKLNYHFIEEFSACWIPDTDDAYQLAGALSHPERMPSIPTSYIGPQSRFSPSQTVSQERHLLVLLSGPEPQRTLLEESLFDQLRSYNGDVVFVRGLPGVEVLPEQVPDHFTVYNHLPSTKLEALIHDASFVISRCGYSTVMDLMVLHKKSILIPTPGQTEQEYLATFLMDKGLAFCASQDQLDILPLLSVAQSYVYAFPEPAGNLLLKKAVRQLVTDVIRKKEYVTQS